MKCYQNILEVFYEADLEFYLYHLAEESLMGKLNFLWSWLFSGEIIFALSVS